MIADEANRMTFRELLFFFSCTIQHLKFYRLNTNVRISSYDTQLRTVGRPGMWALGARLRMRTSVSEVIFRYI
jgi:hypothetical protein